MRRIALVLVALILTGPISAAELAGVTMPDTKDVAGGTLVLNGLGLREATFMKVDVYVAGMYLRAKSTDADAIIMEDAPKRIQLKFVRKVKAKQMTAAWTEGFEHFDGYEAVKDKVDTLNGWMVAIADGDTMAFTYSPGTGTTISINGKDVGTIEGVEFMQGLWHIYLGPIPPNAGLKEGLLGG
jgi:hypothetical protein